jgi:S-DNA-T family DNA segregation ATPase FtsK/SpoIIIE
VVEPAAARAGRREERERQGRPALGAAAFVLPPLGLLAEPKPSAAPAADEALEQNARMLETVLRDFGVLGEIVRVRHGPVVTRYELEPAPGTRAARVIALADDIARSMSAISARVAVIPGQNVIGIELPNRRHETVYLRELLGARDYERAGAELPLVLGKEISGAPVIVDLARMPHLLVAGTTGSGKSVAINSMILSLLYRYTPEQVRLIMIDPKMLELSMYDDIPHLLHPVVIDPIKAVVALKWAVREMNARYRLMSQLNVRNIAGYNKRLAEARARGEALERTVQTGFDAETGRPVYESQPINMTPLPFIVVVVDEMADLMLLAGKDIEVTIQSLAQKARAAGIHLIIATQRPSVDVITGTIKANLPTRVSFQVTSKIDSRTILGEQGAEQLLGRGDMLYMAGGGVVTRVHGPFVSDEEVEEVAGFLRAQGVPDYLDSITEEADDEPFPGLGGRDGSGDELFDRAVAVVARERKASTSFIQRHLSIGYNRAAKIIERMEVEGMVGQANHVGRREVLLPEPGEEG